MILVLGGTKFLGRHVVERLAATGHDVVCFHRGKTPCELPAGVQERFGDRFSDLASVEGNAWDAVIDVNGYEPAQLERSVRLRTQRYAFVSSVSAYRDLSHAGIDETAPTFEAFDESDDAQRYGGNKAACERLVLERFGDRATVVRPGLIVGKWDYTGRFSYWCTRALRGGDVAVAAPLDRPVQFIDAADIARFIVRSVDEGIAGTYNLAGPRDLTTMQALLEVCFARAHARGAPPATARWIDDTVLRECETGEWMEMPLWLRDPQFAGILQVSNTKAVAAGLEFRPIAETVDAVIDDERRALEGVGLSPEREAQLLRGAEQRSTP